MKLDKKGGVGKEWILGLSFIFALAIIVFIFNGVFNYSLAPIFIDLMPNTEAGQAGIDGINSWLSYWKFIPMLILANVLIYILILTVRRSPQEERYIE